MQEAVRQEIFHHSRHSPNLIKVLEDILTGWFQVSQMWYLLLNDIKVIKSQLNIGRMRHGQQVQSSICRTTQSHGHCDCIFKGFACQDVRRLQPHFQHFHNSTTSCFDILLLILGLSWVRRRAWQAHAQNFNSRRHSVGRIHTATATRTRACITLNAAHFLSCQVTMVPFPNSFKDRNQVNILAVQIPRRNRSAVGKDSRNIHISNGNHGARHIFITAPDSYKGIHIMPTHCSLDGVCDDVA